MTNSVTIKTSSKINLFLSVINKRNDGYHNIESLFLETDFGDQLTIEKTYSNIGFSLSSNIKELENTENIIYKIWKKLYEISGKNINVKVRLDKKIPTGSGLGGGSADGVHFMKSIDDMYNLGITMEQKLDISRNIGSDLAFFINGGMQHISGTGDKVLPVSDRQTQNSSTGFDILIAMPKIHISTKEAYESLCISKSLSNKDIKNKIYQSRNNIKNLIEAIKSKNFDVISKYAQNDFEDVIFKMHPELMNIKETMINHGAFCSMMTGSGSAIFGLFCDSSSMENTQKRFDDLNILSVTARPLI